MLRTFQMPLVDDLTFDKTRKIIATQMHASLDAFNSVSEGSGKVNYTQKRTLPILKLPLISRVVNLGTTTKLC